MLPVVISVLTVDFVCVFYMTKTVSAFYGGFQQLPLLCYIADGNAVGLCRYKLCHVIYKLCLLEQCVEFSVSERLRGVFVLLVRMSTSTAVWLV